MRRPVLAITATACLTAAIGAAAQTPAPPSVQRAPAAQRSAGGGVIPTTLITQIRAFAEVNGFPVAGLLHSVGSSSPLFILSNRALIASKFAEAADEHATYRPGPDVRADIVSVSCGDSDIGEILHCTRVTVVNAAGRRVVPLAYRAGPQVFRNAFGATWTVQMVYAQYAIQPLRQGFKVAFVDDGGMERTFAVSEDDARESLLLQMPQRAPLTLAERERLLRDAQAREAADAARRAKENAEWAEKVRQEEQEQMRKTTEAQRVLLAQQSAHAAAEAERRRVAFEAVCQAGATTARGDLQGCSPSVEVCTEVARQKRQMAGCPNTPLRFPGLTWLPRATALPELVIGCANGQLVATVFPGLKLAAAATHSVRVKWGETGAPIRETWIMGPPHNFLNAPDPVKLTEQVGAQQKFAIEVTPVGGVPYVAEFNVGAAPARTYVNQMKSLCGQVQAPG